MRKVSAVALVIILAFNLSSCGSPGEKRYEAQFLELFDTITTVVAYMDSKEEFSKQVELMREDLTIYHQLYDIYEDYEGVANIKTINDNAGKQAVKVDRRIIDLLLFSRDAYELTGGKVNVAFGAVLSIWHDYRTEGIDDPLNAKLPPFEMLKAASLHTDINKMIIDEAKSTVYLADPEMSLDVGAIAKGYATEQISRLARERGFTSGLISVGGNIRIIGTKGNKGEPWNMGITNPDTESEQKNLRIVLLADKSLVTSGNYIRYYTVNGKEYHHIIDPETLYPSAYFTAVTIVCEDSGLADALSTAVYNMPFEQGLAFIESLPEAEAFWVFPDGEQRFSSGFQALLKE